MESLDSAFQQAAAGNEHMEAVNLSREQSDEILAISKRDGGWHDRVLEQAREGRITIGEEEHRGLWSEWKRAATGRRLAT
jgi:hypothetical protein